MTRTALIDEVSHLPPDERLQLVEAVLDGLDQRDATIDRAWADEAKDRLAAYRRGELRASALSDVLAKYKAR